MHFSSSLLLGLAATASAIDIRAHTLDGCNGSYAACTNTAAGFSRLPLPLPSQNSTNTPPNRRAAGSAAPTSAIPTSWRIGTNSFIGGRCSLLAGNGTSRGARTVCMSYSSRGDRTGGSYWFLNRKRAIDETCPVEQPGGGKCEASVEPDVVGLADGTEYSIDGLSKEKVEEILKIANSGAGADAVSAEFQVLRRSIEA